jgi:hypothetical protein
MEAIEADHQSIKLGLARRAFLSAFEPRPALIECALTLAPRFHLGDARVRTREHFR